MHPLRSALALSLVAVCLTAASANEADDLAFFETYIRPVLIDNCYECHSAESTSLKAGLRLDVHQGLLDGGKSGVPAIVPGNADASRLIEALRYTNAELQMPPKAPLDEVTIARFVEWINRGAIDPRTGVSTPSVVKSNPADFWTFSPPTEPTVPAVTNQTWPKTEIDRFILAKLEANGLSPSPPADKRTLLRRVSYDLTGLPPTQAELDAYLADPAPDAFEKVVDRLLASPHYGEQWGRMWLDVARYADTKGYVYGDREDPRFVHSYVYRDWVVNAFNNDMPYDRFLMLQLAADKLTDANTKSDLAAMGFLTLGRRFLGVVHDIIDDRIDTVMRGTQAISVSCARCHDHKFDPVSMQDYYALYGIFSSSSERTICLEDAPEQTEAFLAYQTEHDKRIAKLNEVFAQKRTELADRLRTQMPEYMAALLDVGSLPTEDFYEIRQANEVNPTVARAWFAYIQKHPDNDPVWGLWKALSALKPDEFAAAAPAILAQWTAPGAQTNAVIAQMFRDRPPVTLADVAKQYGEVFKGVQEMFLQVVKTSTDAGMSPPTALPDPNQEAIRQELYADTSPVWVPNGAIVDLEWYFDEPTRVELSKLQKEIDNHIIEDSASPRHAVVLEDKQNPRNARIFRRGNPANRGDEVPRLVPAILSRSVGVADPSGSGRLELAKAIANEKNPLTARVMVNRVWLHHFGTGLIDTPSDFGIRSEAPAHRELLDWLAVQFVRDGWSIKTLHKRILLSSVYQQATGDLATDAPSAQFAANAPGVKAVDPQNRLYSHFNRRRLTFEEMRDAILTATAELDTTIGGRPVDITKAPFTTRRSVYGYVDRQFLPGLFRVFDYPNPDMHSPKRYDTTVPQQALFFMNSPFLMERSRKLAARLTEASDVPEERVVMLYRALYQREPTTDEVSRAITFLASTAPIVSPEPPAITPDHWQYGYGELDPVSLELKSFETLPHFTGDTWQGGDKWPDSTLGWLRLTAEGGHAGDDHAHTAIRRWVSPTNGTVWISATLKHAEAQGDGVAGYVFGPGPRLLGTWTAQNSEVKTELTNIRVRKGDTIDFVVDLRGNISNDMFEWAPTISLGNPTAEGAPADMMSWNAAKEFVGPPTAAMIPLSPWEQYAQVLLLTNEFVFVD